GTGGSLHRSSSITINNSGTLLLDDSVNAVPGRLLSTTPLTLQGGTFNLLAPATQTFSQSIGTITLLVGASTINVHSANDGINSTTLQVAGLSRIRGATVNFIATNSDFGTTSNQLTFTNLPALTGSGNNAIFNYGIVSPIGTSGYDFATLSGNSLVRFSNY